MVVGTWRDIVARPTNRQLILDALSSDAPTAEALRDIARRLGFDVRVVKRHLEAEGYVETFVKKPARSVEAEAE